MDNTIPESWFDSPADASPKGSGGIPESWFDKDQKTSATQATTSDDKSGVLGSAEAVASGVGEGVVGLGGFKAGMSAGAKLSPTLAKFGLPGKIAAAAAPIAGGLVGMAVGNRVAKGTESVLGAEDDINSAQAAHPYLTMGAQAIPMLPEAITSVGNLAKMGLPKAAGKVALGSGIGAGLVYPQHLADKAVASLTGGEQPQQAPGLNDYLTGAGFGAVLGGAEHLPKEQLVKTPSPETIKQAQDLADAGASETGKALLEVEIKRQNQQPEASQTTPISDEATQTPQQPGVETGEKGEDQNSSSQDSEEAEDQVGESKSVAPEVSPKAQDLADELEIDITEVPPNKHGRVTVADIRKWQNSQTQPRAEQVSETPAASQAALPVEQIRTPEQYLDNRGGLGRLRLNERLAPSDKYPQGQPSLSELLHVAVRDQDAESLQWIHNEMQQRMAKPSFQKEQMLLQARNAIVRLTGQEPVAPTLKVSGDNNAPRVIKGGPEITNPALKVAAARALSTEQNPPAVNQVEIRQPEVTEPTGTEHLDEVEPDTEDQMPDPLPAEEGDEQGEKEFIDSVNEQYPGQYTHDILQSLYRAKDSDQFTQWATTHYPDIAKNPAIAKSLYSEFWDVSSSSTQPAPKRIDASDAAHAKANELGIDIVEVTPSNGTRITVNDVKEHFKDLEKNQAEPESYDDEDEQDFEDLESQGETPKAKPNFWFRTPEAEAFLKDLLDQREKAASDNPAISEPAKARLAELQLQARENPNLLLNDVVDLNDAHAKSFDFAGVPDEYESIPLTGAEWADETIEPRGDKSLRRVVLPDGRITFVDLNSIPEGLRDYLDQNTPPFDQKPSITKLSKLLGVSRNAITGQKTSEGHKPGFIDYGMPTGSEKAAKAWYSRYVTDKRFNSETNRAYNNRTSLDREIGEGGTASVQDLVGDGDSSDLNIGGNIAQNSEVRVESITDRALAHMDRKDVPLSRRIAVGQKILEGAESLGLSDEELIPITAKLKKLESQPNYAESKKEAESLIKQNNFDAEQLMDNVDGNGKFDVSPLRAIDAGSQGETQQRGEVIRTTHAEDALQKIAADPKNDSMVNLVAQHLLDRFAKSGRLLRTPVDIHNRLESGVLGEYDPATGRIALEENSAAETILEEVLHSLTADRNLPREIHDLFKKIQKEAVKKGLTSREQWTSAADPTVLNKGEGDAFHYAFSNPHELLAAALKNREVRDALNDLEVRDSITGKLVSAWKYLKGELFKWLGFNVKKDSALDQYLNKMFDHMSEGDLENTTLDGEGGNGVLYSNAKATDQSQSGTEEQPKIGFLYTKGGLNTESPYRGSESLRLLTEAIASNTGGDEGAGEKNGELGDSFKRLREVVDKAGLNIAAPFFKRVANPRTEVGEPGAEHSVYGDPRTNRVIKLTHADQEGDGIVGAKGSANNYFTSQLLVKEILGMDTQFEGLVDLGGKLPQVVTSQPWVKGDNATIPEIQADLKARGFTKKIARKDVNIWTNKTLGVDIYDARPANVLKDSEGNLHYIDVDLIPNRPVADILADIQSTRKAAESSGKLRAIKTTKQSKSIYNAKDNPTEYEPTSMDEVESEAGKYLKGFSDSNGNFDPKAALADLQTRGAFIGQEAKFPAARMIQASYEKRIADLNARRASGEVISSPDLTAAQKGRDQAYRLAGELKSTAGQTLVSLKGDSQYAASTYVDSYLKSVLGGSMDELTQGKINVDALKDGMAAIKQQVADVTVDSAKKLLGVFGISDEAKIDQIKAEMGDLNSDPKNLKGLLGQLMGSEASPEKVTALTQQLNSLYNAAHARMTPTRLSKLVAETYNGLVRKGDQSTLAKQLATQLKQGRFDEDTLNGSLLDSIGITGYDADTVKTLRDQVNFIQSQPEGSSQRNLAVDKLKGALANMEMNLMIKSGFKGKMHAGFELIPDLFRSAVLTSPSTTTMHGAGGLVNTRVQAAFDAYGNFRAARNAGASFSEASGFFKDFLDTCFIGDKGERGSPLLREAWRAVRTGTIGMGLAKGTGKRGADLHGDGVGSEAFQKYCKALAIPGRLMSAWDALNAGTAQEVNQKYAMRAALLNKGVDGPKIATAMKRVFAPSKEELQVAREALDKEVNSGAFDSFTKPEQFFLKGERLEQLHKQIQLAETDEELVKLLGSEDIQRAVDRYTYKGKPKGVWGAASDLLNTLNKNSKVTTLLVPFTNIVGHLMNTSLEFTPLGALRAKNASLSNLFLPEGSKYAWPKMVEGSPEQIALMTKSIVGTMATAFITSWFLKELHDEEMTGKPPGIMFYGSGPKDPNRHQSWMASGAKPDTMKIGDHYFPYKTLPAISLLGAALGAMHDMYIEESVPRAHGGKLPTPQQIAKAHEFTWDKAMRLGVALAATPLTHEYLSGLRNVITIAHDPEGPGAAKAVWSQVSGSLSQLTNPSLLRTIRNANPAAMNADYNVPNLDLSTTTGKLFQFIPGYLGYNQQALNILGDPIDHKFFAPLTDRWVLAATAKPDPIISTLVNNGLYLPEARRSTPLIVDRKGTKMKVADAGDEAWRAYQIARGQFLKRVLSPNLVQRLTQMDRVQAQSILLGPSIAGASAKYAQAIVEREVLRGKIKVNS